MRTNLKIFRITQHLSQTEISEKIGCSRATYSAIENGTRDGRPSFWRDLKEKFVIPDSEMWQLMKNDES